jgi:hypothetical protein
VVDTGLTQEPPRLEKKNEFRYFQKVRDELILPDFEFSGQDVLGFAPQLLQQHCKANIVGLISDEEIDPEYEPSLLSLKLL